ncbi:hypothetical protein T45_02849 [Streptomyces turgidiscabies]|nr:hypothetical protein T45_02849 [Streptomyces turgidiscabies]
MASAISLVRMPPEALTSMLAMMSAVRSITKPAIATARFTVGRVVAADHPPGTTTTGQWDRCNRVCATGPNRVPAPP